MSGCNRTIETGSRSGSIVPGNIPAINFSARPHSPVLLWVLYQHMNVSKPVEVLQDANIQAELWNFLSNNRKDTARGRLKLSMHGDVVSCAVAIVTNVS